MNPGVLVLSGFAGTAQELDGAPIVDPYDMECVAESAADANAWYAALTARLFG